MVDTPRSRSLLLADQLRAELNLLFGPPRAYNGNVWWSLKGEPGLDARVNVDCEGGACELWVGGEESGAEPHMLATIDGPAAVDEVIRELRRMAHDRA